MNGKPFKITIISNGLVCHCRQNHILPGRTFISEFQNGPSLDVEVIEVEVLSHEKVGVYLNVIKLMVRSVFPTCLLPSKEDETYIIFVT